MRDLLAAVLALACIACCCSIARTLDEASPWRFYLVVASWLFAIPAIIASVGLVRLAGLDHSLLAAVTLSIACVGCCVWIARALDLHYRQGYVGSAVMFAKVLHEQSYGLSLLTPDEPIKPVRLSDPSEGGPR